MSVRPSALARQAAAAAVVSDAGFHPGRARRLMVGRLRSGGVRSEAVLAALEAVPRHEFVDDAFASRAYEEIALPIGHGQSISRPLAVARMLDALLTPAPAATRPPGGWRALEIGTGCGYQAAVMARVFDEVYSIERIRSLHELARRNLRPMRIANLRLVFGDGHEGVSSAAPFDAICVAAAGAEIPQALLTQLRVGGRLVAPVGEQEQTLHLVERVSLTDWRLTVLDEARFVPMRAGTV